MSSIAVPTIADAIENTLEWLDRQGCRLDAQERRLGRRSRYRVRAKVSYTPAGAEQGASFEVATRNLSRNGLSFVHSQLIYPRQQVQVQLPLPDKSVRQISARVARVRSAGQGLYDIGVEFTDVEVALAG